MQDVPTRWHLSIGIKGDREGDQGYLDKCVQAEGMASTKALEMSGRSLVICLKLISEYVMGFDKIFFRLRLGGGPQREKSLPLVVPEGWRDTAKHLQFTHTHTPNSYISSNVSGKGDRT